MMPAAALSSRGESNRQPAVAEKVDIAQLILAVLSPFSYGLTTREIVELTGMASYNASGKLSKMAACGKIEGFTIKGARHIAANIAKLPELLKSGAK